MTRNPKNISEEDHQRLHDSSLFGEATVSLANIAAAGGGILGAAANAREHGHDICTGCLAMDWIMNCTVQVLIRLDDEVREEFLKHLLEELEGHAVSTTAQVETQAAGGGMA